MKRALAAMLVLAMTAAPAAADSHRKRYTRKIVKTDLEALGLLTVGAIIEGFSMDKSNPATEGLAFLSFGVYAIGPAYVHSRQGNPRGAMRSAATRIALPAAGAAFAFATDDGANFDNIALGTFAGMGAAMILDWTIFARRPATEVFVAPRGDGAGVVLGIGGSL